MRQTSSGRIKKYRELLAHEDCWAVALVLDVRRVRFYLRAVSLVLIVTAMVIVGAHWGW